MSEVRLTTDKKLWTTDSRQDLQVEYQLQGGDNLTGRIEFGTNGQWIDVSSGPWFNGSDSPFQVNRSGQVVVVRVNQPPTEKMDFRVVITGGPVTVESNTVKVKIVNKTPVPAPAPPPRIFGRKW